MIPIVEIVGAGPGSAELLTVRAHRLISGADVVVHDRLVTDEVLAIAPKAAERLCAGRRAGAPGPPFDEVMDVMAGYARLGRRVVRIHGGDATVFGRGGEELRALVERGVSARVTPGITNAVAAAELAGFSLTERGVSTGFLVVTAQRADGVVSDWSFEASFTGTLVVLMGLGRLESIARALVEAGRSAATPVAVVSCAGTPAQRTVVGTLATIAAQAADVPAPATIIVGDVVSLQAPTRGRKATASRLPLPA